VEFSAVNKHPVTLGLAAAGVVFIAAMSLVDSLRTTFYKIFRREPPTSLLLVQLGNVRSAAIMFLLFAALIGAEVLFLALAHLLQVRGLMLTYTGNVLLSVCLATICTALFYFLFLPVRLTVPKLICAAVMSAVLIIAMREFFAFIIRTNPAYGETFGSLKVLFVMIVWVYYCFLVILFGAEVAVNTGKRDSLLLKRLFAGTLPAGLLTRFVIYRRRDDVIFREGDTGDAIFYIVSGVVDIMRGGSRIKTMAAGDYFGEISMLLGTPRSAGARVASEGAELIPISRGNFDIILRENGPIVLSILKEMANRLKDTDESLLRG
jgi:membrane protein